MYYFEVLSNLTRDEIIAVFLAFTYIFVVCGIADAIGVFIGYIMGKPRKVKKNEKKDS